MHSPSLSCPFSSVFFFALDSVPRALLLRKPKQFDFPCHSYQTTSPTDISIQDRDKNSTASVNKFGVLQGTVLSLYLFSTFTINLHSSSPGQLFIYADEIASCQFVPRTTDFLNSNNFSFIHNFSVSSGFNLNLSKCIESLFTFLDMHIRLILLYLTEPFTSVDPVKYLGITIGRNLVQSFPFSNYLKNPRRLSSYLKRLRHFQAR